MGRCCCCNKRTDYWESIQLTDGEICGECYHKALIADNSLNKLKLSRSRCCDIKTLFSSDNGEKSDIQTTHSKNTADRQVTETDVKKSRFRFSNIVEIILLISLILVGYTLKNRANELKEDSGAPPSNIIEEIADNVLNYFQKTKYGVELDRYPYVETIKSAKMPGYSCTYNQAFSYFFGNPKWRHFTSNEGFEVVEFTGDCEYYNQPVKALIQFKITSKDNNYMTWKTHYLSFNNVRQDLFVLSGLLEKAAKEYLKTNSY